MTVNELIEQVKELDKGATKGPWGSHEGHVYSTPVCRGTEPIIGDFAVQAAEAMFTSQSVCDADFSAQSRTLLPLMARLLEVYAMYADGGMDAHDVHDCKAELDAILENVK